MKYVTYLYDNKESVGFLNESDNAVYPLPFADMNALIEAPKEKLEVVIKEAKNKILLSDVTLLAPIPRPKQDVICLGINYKAHAIEELSSGMTLMPGTIIATGTPSQLIENMQGKVGEVVCTLSDVADLQGKYHIGNIRQRKNGMVLRLVGDELPEEAVRVDNDIDLEDVYLYYFE